MKSTTKAKRLPVDLQTAVDTQFQRLRENLTSIIILPSAAKNAPSMAWTAILTTSLVYINHTCCKYGKSCPTCCKFGSAIMTTQLGAFLAALFRQHPLGSIILATPRQSKSSSHSHKKGSHHKATTCDFMEPATRLELVTPALRERCSTN